MVWNKFHYKLLTAAACFECYRVGQQDNVAAWWHMLLLLLLHVLRGDWPAACLCCVLEVGTALAVSPWAGIWWDWQVLPWGSGCTCSPTSGRWAVSWQSGNSFAVQRCPQSCHAWSGNRSSGTCGSDVGAAPYRLVWAEELPLSVNPRSYFADCL